MEIAEVDFKGFRIVDPMFLYGEDLNSGVWKIDEEKYNRMLDEYYDLHGWDRETSFPTRETLAQLDLGYVADDLEKIGKLG